MKLVGLEKAIKILKDDKQNHVAKYNAIAEDGTVISLNNTACHAALRYLAKAWGDGYFINYNVERTHPEYHIPFKSRPKNIINKVMQINTDKDVAVRFYDWLINRSPYRGTFLPMTGEEVVKERIIISDCAAPANMLTAGLMASRFPTEGANIPYSCGLWDELVQNGVDPRAAFVVSHALGGTATAIYPQSIAHTSMHIYTNGGNGSNEVFWNFLRETPRGVGKPYREAMAYDGIDDMWRGKVDRAPIPGIIPEAIKSLSGAKKTLGKQANPFGAALKVEAAGKYERKAALKALAEFLVEVVKMDEGNAKHA